MGFHTFLGWVVLPVPHTFHLSQETKLSSPSLGLASSVSFASILLAVP